MTTHREKLLGQARADLTALPGLTDELVSCLTERGPTIGKQGKVSGSPALIRLDVFRLIDSRRKQGWELEDPRYTNLTDWLGVAPLLESWVRVLCDDLPGNIELTEDEAWVRTIWGDLPAVIELTETATVRSEASVLVEFWPFIEAQQWADELAKDVSGITETVRAALGIRKAQRYKCPKCGNPAHLVPGGILSCEEGHERVVRDLEAQQRRRPMATTKEICEEFNVTSGLLRQWKLRRRISPAREERGGSSWWFPWDVFCLVNPDIAEAIKLRDEVSDGPRSA